MGGQQAGPRGKPEVYLCRTRGTGSLHRKFAQDDNDCWPSLSSESQKKQKWELGNKTSRKPRGAKESCRSDERSECAP